MKKILLGLLAITMIGAGVMAAYRFESPARRFEKHIGKARILLRRNDAAGAKREFQAAYALRGGYRPTVSEEVLSLELESRLKENRREEAIALAREFLKGANARNAKVRLTLARLLLEGGDFDAAFSLLSAMIAENPSDLRARGLLAAVRTRQGRPDLAEQQFRQMVKAYPDSASLLILLAENLELQGNHEERRALLRRALDLQPKNPQARLALVDAWLKDQKPDSAMLVLADWENADTALGYQIALRKSAVHSLTGGFAAAHADLAQFLDQQPAHAGAYFEDAVIFAKQGQYDSARSVYRIMGPEFPAKSDIIARCDALLLLVEKKPAEALSAIQTRDPALEHAENRAIALYAYLALGDETRSREIADMPQAEGSPKTDYRNLVAQAEKDPGFLSGLALVNFFLLARQPYQTLKACERFHKAYPTNPLAVTLLADQYRAIGRPDLVYQVLSKVPKPNHSQRLLMAGYLLAVRRDREAMALLEKDLADSAAAGANLMLAEAYAKSGNADRAAGYYERELLLDGGNIAALNNLAWHYGVVRKDPARAAPYLASLQSRAQSDPRILDTIGWIYALNGEAGKGEAFLRQAACIIPDNPAFLYHLAFAQARGGSKAQARSGLEKALASPERWDEKADAAALLKSLI